VATSQPSPARLLQSVKPVLQLRPQVLFVQEAAAFGAPGHALPHMPQLFGSPVTLDSQPLAGMPSQSPTPHARASHPGRQSLRD
jgi:hypothetical protein